MGNRVAEGIWEWVEGEPLKVEKVEWERAMEGTGWKG